MLITANTVVYLIRPVGGRTWYGMHDVSQAARPTSTLTVFCDEADARRWAHSMEVYMTKHGCYPAREYRRLPKRMTWLRPAGSCEAATLDTLEVVEMPFSQTVAMVKGTGVQCAIMLDIDCPRQKIEVAQPFDRATVCAKLSHTYESH